MYSKAPKCSGKKIFPQTYLVKKLGRRAKRVDRESSLRKTKKLENYEPMSIEYLNYLAKVLKRRIQIWSEDKIIRSFGKYSGTPGIDIKYEESYSKCVDGNLIKIGHFTLKNGEDAPTASIYPNDCLLQIISAQTGFRPNRLWREIARKVKKLKSTCRLKNFNYKSKGPSSLIVGGAKYIGKSKTDAKKILDQSQNGKSHPEKVAGHPRGHASHPKATGSNDSVEKYSLSKRKTGFFSRSDQDFVAHFFLKNSDSQDAMELLNEKGIKGEREVVKIRAKDLRIDESKLPDIQEWFGGTMIGDPGRINKVVAVMKHFYEKYDDDNENVFILTLYPTL